MSRCVGEITGRRNGMEEGCVSGEIRRQGNVRSLKMVGV